MQVVFRKLISHFLALPADNLHYIQKHSCREPSLFHCDPILPSPRRSSISLLQGCTNETVKRSSVKGHTRDHNGCFSTAMLESVAKERY